MSLAQLCQEVQQVLEAWLGAELDPLVLEPPARIAFGDLALPCFPYAALARKAPAAIAADLAPRLEGLEGVVSVSAAGPFVNFFLDPKLRAQWILEGCAPGAHRSSALAGQKVLVEFSSPNANKPMHLGHIRNNLLGDVLCRLLQSQGAEVVRTNLINDRGLPIFKSLVQWREQRSTPEEQGIKGDLFVGQLYVAFAQQEAKEKAEGEAQLAAQGSKLEGLERDRAVQALCPSLERAHGLMGDWEQGEPSVCADWERLTNWVLGGFEDTYRRQGIAFDRVDRESQVYQEGKSLVENAVEQGWAQRDDDGSVWVDLEDKGLDRKLLLRSDGTSVYITQDLGVAARRHAELNFTRAIYVVGSEQDYHFKALFGTLERMEMSWAQSLEHLSYGMIALPDGRMKSREGRVVDADDLMDEVVRAVEQQMGDRVSGALEGGASEHAKAIAATPEQLKVVAEQVGLGAIRFFVLKFNPRKDFVFDPEASISLQGDTGPYVQYSAARCAQLLAKAQGLGIAPRVETGLDAEPEREVLLALQRWPGVVASAARGLNPSAVCTFLLELCRAFNAFYAPQAGLPILTADPPLAATRLALVEGLRQVLVEGMALLGMDAPSRM